MQANTMTHPMASRAATLTRLGLLAALVIGLGLSVAFSHHSTAEAHRSSHPDTSIETVSSRQPRAASRPAVLRALPAHPGEEPTTH